MNLSIDSVFTECGKVVIEPVYIGRNGKTVWVRFAYHKKTTSFKILDDVAFAVRPPQHESNLGEVSKSRLCYEMVDLIFRSQNPPPSGGYNNAQIAWRTEFSSIKDGIFKQHSRFFVELAARLTTESRSLAASKETGSKRSAAIKQSAIARLRSPMMFAVRAGLELSDIQKLWNSLVVQTVMKN